MRAAGIALMLIRTAAGEEDGRFVARTWTTAEGLPSNTVTSLAQSADGYLWIGTPRGLCRFDGFRFVVCGPEEGMPATDIQRMVSDREGRIWVQDKDWDIRVRQGGTFQPGPGGMAVDQAAADGSIWGLGRTAFTRWAEGTVSGIPFPPGWRRGDAIKLLATRDHGLLALSWKGEIRRWREGEWSGWTGHQGSESDNWAGALLEDSAGAVWVNTEADKVWRITAGEKKSYSLARIKNGFWEMIERRPGEIWATGTEGSLWRLEGEEFRKFPLPAETVATRLLVDASGALWVATISSGLLRIDSAAVSTRRLEQQAGGGRISALAELEPGFFAVGTRRGGTWQWRDGQSSPWPAGDEEFQTYIYCNAMVKGRDGTLWVGTNFALHQFRDGRRVTGEHLKKMIEPGDSVMALRECRDGSLLAGTATGRLYRVTEGKFESIPLAPCQSTVADIIEAPGGALWVATKWDGIFRMEGGAVTHFDERDGLASKKTFSLFSDSRGRLWAGLGTEGLFGFRDGRFVRAALKGAGAGNAAVQLMEDDRGWLWFGGDQGISGCSLDEAAASLAGGPPADTAHAGMAEGMASEQCLAMKPLKASDGRILFGTMKGFVSFRPEDLKTRPEPPAPTLEGILINGRRRSLSPEGPMVEIPPDARFEVHFTGIDLRQGENLRFRCRLKGFESQWNEVGNRRFASYTKVPPGTYDFEVASGNSGQWNPAPAHVKILVRPNFWQNPWCQAVLGLAAACGVAFSSRAWERARTRRKTAALERVNGERARIAMDLHDGIGSGLTQVGMMAAALQRELAVSGQAEDSSKLLRQRIRGLAQELDIAVWATSPRHDHVAALCTYLSEHMTEYFRDSGIRCWISIPDDLPDTPIRPEIRHHLFMGAREAMNNCLKHSQATEIVLSVVRSDDRLIITLSDNGVGFVPGRMEESRRNGLKNLMERMTAAGGTATVETGGQGTRVTFSFAPGANG